MPCLAYPGLKKYSHLVGNYGSAWQNQRNEFDEFPVILMTTNCIQKPRIPTRTGFSRRPWRMARVRHIGPDKDFSPVIEAAQLSPVMPKMLLNNSSP